MEVALMSLRISCLLDILSSDAKRQRKPDLHYQCLDMLASAVMHTRTHAHTYTHTIGRCCWSEFSELTWMHLICTSGKLYCIHIPMCLIYHVKYKMMWKAGWISTLIFPLLSLTFSLFHFVLFFFSFHVFLTVPLQPPVQRRCLKCHQNCMKCLQDSDRCTVCKKGFR